jgi:hypothetical protein
MRKSLMDIPGDRDRSFRRIAMANALEIFALAV